MKIKHCEYCEGTGKIKVHNATELPCDKCDGTGHIILNKRRRYKEIIKARLNHCEQQNGVPYCKNCGLSEDDL